MRHPVKVPVALGVLSAGIGAACLFLKAPQETQPLGVGLTPLVQVAEANQQPLMELKAGSHASPAPLGATGVVGTTAIDESPASRPRAVPFETTLPLAWPRLAREYPDSYAIGNQPSDSAQVRPTMHTVVDGDTLAKLARRYLGSADRQGELFEANRQLLADPELLPIGAVLRIPSPDRQP